MAQSHFSKTKSNRRTSEVSGARDTLVARIVEREVAPLDGGASGADEPIPAFGTVESLAQEASDRVNQVKRMSRHKARIRERLASLRGELKAIHAEVGTLAASLQAGGPVPRALRPILRFIRPEGASIAHLEAGLERIAARIERLIG